MKSKRTSDGVQRIESFGSPRALGARTADDPTRRAASVQTLASMLAKATAAEREACAKVVEALKPQPSPTATSSAEVEAGIRWDAFDDAVEAIRARGGK